VVHGSKGSKRSNLIENYIYKSGKQSDLVEKKKNRNPAKQGEVVKGQRYQTVTSWGNEAISRLRPQRPGKRTFLKKEGHLGANWKEPYHCRKKGEPTPKQE